MRFVCLLIPFLVLGLCNAYVLPSSTLKGALDVNNQPVYHMKSPVNATDPATRGYADTSMSLYLPLTAANHMNASMLSSDVLVNYLPVTGANSMNSTMAIGAASSTAGNFVSFVNNGGHALADSGKTTTSFRAVGSNVSSNEVTFDSLPGFIVKGPINFAAHKGYNALNATATQDLMTLSQDVESRDCVTVGFVGCDYNTIGTDATSVIQAAIDYCYDSGLYRHKKTTVLLKVGNYTGLGATSITVRPGILLRGSGYWDSTAYLPGSEMSATTFTVTSTSNPAIVITPGAMVDNIRGWYPKQTHWGPPVEYPAFISDGGTYTHNNRITNIGLGNSYKGIDFSVDTATNVIEHIRGYPYAWGIHIKKSWDIDRINDVHFHPFWSGNGYDVIPGYSKWVVACGGPHFFIEGCDEDVISQSFSILCRIGFKVSGNGIQLTNCMGDACLHPLALADSSGAIVAGFVSFANSTTASNGIEIYGTAGSSNTNHNTLIGCYVGAAGGHGIYINSSKYNSIIGCTIRGWNKYSSGAHCAAIYDTPADWTTVGTTISNVQFVALSDAGTRGVDIGGQEASIQGCVLLECQDKSVYLRSSTYNHIVMGNRVISPGANSTDSSSSSIKEHNQGLVFA